MPRDDRLVLWGYALTFVGGVLSLAATFATVLLSLASEPGFEVGAGALLPVLGHRLPPGIVLVWGLAAGSIILGAAMNLREASGTRAWTWSIVAVVAAVLVWPVTTGFALAGTIAITGPALAMAAQLREPSRR